MRGRFDCITCLEVLEHFSEEEQEVFFADVWRFIKPGGLVVISVPVMIGKAGFIKVAQQFVGSRLLNREIYTLWNALCRIVTKGASVN